ARPLPANAREPVSARGPAPVRVRGDAIDPTGELRPESGRSMAAAIFGECGGASLASGFGHGTLTGELGPGGGPPSLTDGKAVTAPPDGSEEQSGLADVAVGGPRAFGGSPAIREPGARALPRVGQLLFRAVV